MRDPATTAKVLDMTVDEYTNGVEPAPLSSPVVPPSPTVQWGMNIAAVLTGIAAGLPEELTPQSRYQLALQLTQTLLQTQAATALVPPGGQA
jgi:hypothetical protein